MTGSVVAKPGRAGRLLTNFGWLAGGRTVAAILSLAATAMAAHALGAADFGMVVMLHAAALMIRQLCNIKTSEAVIRFGVPLAEDARTAELKGLLLRFVRLDLAAALLAGLSGALLLGMFAENLGLSKSLTGVAWIYLPALLLSITGTAKGTLRLLDRFGVLSTQLAIGPFVKFSGVLLLAILPISAAIWHYILVWAFAYMTEHAYTWWRAIRTFRKTYGDTSGVAPKLNRREVRSFLITVYWQSTLDAAPKQAATLLAGSLLGSAAAGMFSIARELAFVVEKPIVILRQIVFPDLARLWRNDLPRFVRVTWRTGATSAGIGLLIVLGSLVLGEGTLTLLAGADFAPAAGLLTMLLLSASIDLGGASLRPASYVMGKARALLMVQIAATTVYLLGFALLVSEYGLIGIGWASVLSACVGVSGAGWLVVRGCRQRHVAEQSCA